MNYAQLDRIADSVNILLAIGVIGGALWLERGAAWRFLGRAIGATILVQQGAKLFQKVGWLGPHFPSTHFAVALCLATFGVVLRRQSWPLALAIVVAYGALMLHQGYHTPLEMLGAFYAVPLAWWLGIWRRRRAPRASLGQN